MNTAQIIITIFSVIILILALLLFTGIIGPRANRQDPNIEVTGHLSVWGVEDESIFRKSFAFYKDKQKIEINYTQGNPTSFNENLVRAIARGQGPDLVIQEATWIGSNTEILSPAPPEKVNLRDFQNAFVDAASNALVQKNKIWALPLWIDPLVLYWNKDIFNGNSISIPPKDWAGVVDVSRRIQNLGDGGGVFRSGVAMGRAKNIPLYKEILSLLLLQLGGNMEDASGQFIFGNATGESKSGNSALTFYTDFGKLSSNVYTWNYTLPEPRVLFLQGKLGMMIDYISYSPDIIAKSPHLLFDIAPVPQVEKAEFPIHFGNIEGVAVVLNAPNASIVWDFAKYLVSPDSVRLFMEQKLVAPARRDSLGDAEFKKLSLAPLLAEAALNARTVFDSHPVENSTIISEMIESVGDGKLGATDAIVEATTKANKNRK